MGLLIRQAAEAIAKLTGATAGSWILELTYQDGKFLNLRRHHGPVRTDDDLDALARSVGS